MPETPNEDLTRALDRMVELGWVEKYAYSAAHGFVVDYTDLGAQQLGGFWHFLKAIGGDNGLESIDNTLWRGLITASLLKFGSLNPKDEPEKPEDGR